MTATIHPDSTVLLHGEAGSFKVQMVDPFGEVTVMSEDYLCKIVKLDQIREIVR